MTQLLRWAWSRDWAWRRVQIATKNGASLRVWPSYRSHRKISLNEPI